jgi:hypothetical protein
VVVDEKAAKAIKSSEGRMRLKDLEAIWPTKQWASATVM